MKTIWKGLCLFFYRRWATADEAKPVGVPGNRDPDAICAAYSPRSKNLGDWADCLTDGHYLCRECCHRDESPKEPAALQWIKVTTHTASAQQAEPADRWDEDYSGGQS